MSIKLILIYLAIVNILTFVVYGIDKRRARKKKWRISESTLLWLAVVGGSVGALVGMKVWHHKTLHKKFKYGVPAIIVLQIAAVCYVLCHYIIQVSQAPLVRELKGVSGSSFACDAFEERINRS